MITYKSIIVENIKINNANFDIAEWNNNTIEMTINGEQVGTFSVQSEGAGDYVVGKVLINKEYQNKGYYKLLITAAFKLLNIKTLRSDTRNIKSNPIYEFWTGENLEFDTPVWITYVNNKLNFDL